MGYMRIKDSLLVQLKMDRLWNQRGTEGWKESVEMDGLSAPVMAALKWIVSLQTNILKISNNNKWLLPFLSTYPHMYRLNVINKHTQLRIWYYLTHRVQTFLCSIIWFTSKLFTRLFLFYVTLDYIFFQQIIDPFL